MADSPKKPGPASAPAPSATAEASVPKKRKIKKLLMYGVLIGVVQIVLLYFIIGRLTGPAAANKNEAVKAEQSTEKTEGGESKAPSYGASLQDSNFVYVVKDIIVNPAGTNGSRFLLTTIGLEVTSPEMLGDLEKKEVQVRDALITILSSKTLGEIDRITERDSLRIEINQKLSSFVRDGILRNVYFSKFIIQ